MDRQRQAKKIYGAGYRNQEKRNKNRKVTKQNIKIQIKRMMHFQIKEKSVCSKFKMCFCIRKMLKIPIGKKQQLFMRKFTKIENKDLEFYLLF